MSLSKAGLDIQFMSQGSMSNSARLFTIYFTLCDQSEVPKKKNTVVAISRGREVKLTLKYKSYTSTPGFLLRHQALVVAHPFTILPLTPALRFDPARQVTPR